jgi:hypothetical protein
VVYCFEIIKIKSSGTNKIPKFRFPGLNRGNARQALELAADQGI